MDQIFKIISFTKKFWKWYLLMGVFIISVSLLSLVIPLLIKQIVDLIVKQLTGSQVDIGSLVNILILMILADIAITFLTAFGQWIGDLFTVRLQTYLTKIFYEHLLKLDIGFYDNEITGKIVNKMYRGISSITDFLQSMMNNFLPFFLSAVVTISLLAYYSVFIAVLLAVLFPIYTIISHKSTLAWGEYEGKKNAINDRTQGRVFESISGIRVVKSFAAEINELLSYLTSRKSIEDITHIQTKQWHFYDFLRRIALNIILFAIFAYIVYWTFHGRYSIGEMTLLMQLVQQARFPLFAMSFILGQIQQANAGSKDFFEILEKQVKIKDKEGAKKLSIRGQGSGVSKMIEFKGIDFNYDQGKSVLKNINFSVKPNEKLALVGESGQGKSTIVNLLLRYYEPQKGVITINGQNVSEVTLKSIHEKIAVVFQESLLFSGTIMENIKYGKPDATIEEIEDVARAANAHEFIKELPDKLNSVIGERGVKLSGGQRQRISIARAMLKDAPIIILDEATSSLDSRSEIQVQQGLDRLMRNRTSIIIAHRLSTIADADNILVIAKGTIAQYGSAAELIKDKKGLYYQLVTLQQKLLTATPEERDEALKRFDLVG